MFDVENTSKKNQVFLLGLSLAELMLILIFILGLLIAIGLHLGSKNETTQAADLGSCDVELNTAKNALALLSIEKSQALAHCDSQLVTLQTNHESSERLVIEQQETIESLELEKLALTQAMEERLQLASAMPKVSEDKEQILQLIALLEENGLYMGSALNSVEELIQTNALMSVDVDTKTASFKACESETQAGGSDKMNTNSELFNNHTSLKQDNQECLARLASQKAKYGLDFPACWELENGQPDYIFNVTATTEGYVVEKAYREKREPRALKIPGIREMHGKSLSEANFSIEADKIFSWSKARNCRHYVRVYDAKDTPDQTADLRLKNIQTYFYVFKP
jgi:hypothetical protein